MGTIDNRHTTGQGGAKSHNQNLHTSAITGKPNGSAHFRDMHHAQETKQHPQNKPVPHAPETPKHDPVSKQEQSLKSAHNFYKGRLKNIQDVEERLANASIGDRLTGNIGRWEKERDAEYKMLAEQKRAMEAQKKALAATREAQKKSEDAQKALAAEKSQARRKELAIKAQKAKDDLDDRAKEGKKAKKIDGSGYMKSMQKAYGQRRDENKEIDHHNDLKTDVQRVKQQPLAKSTGRFSRQVEETMLKYEKSMHGVVSHGGGIASNVADTTERLDGENKANMLRSGMGLTGLALMYCSTAPGLNNELKNDKALLNGNNKIAQAQLANYEKLKETHATIATYEQRAAEYIKLGDPKTAADYTAKAKKLTDSILHETNLSNENRKSDTKKIGGQYIEKQQEVNKQYEAAADRADKIAKGLKMTSNVADKLGETVAMVGFGPQGGAVWRMTVGSAINLSENVSSYATGTKTADEALHDSGKRLVEDTIGAGIDLIGGKIFQGIGSSIAPQGATLGKQLLANQLGTFSFSLLSQGGEFTRKALNGEKITTADLKAAGLSVGFNQLGGLLGFRTNMAMTPRLTEGVEGVTNSLFKPQNLKAMGFAAAGNFVLASGQQYLTTGRVDAGSALTTMANSFAGNMAQIKYAGFGRPTEQGNSLNTKEGHTTAEPVEMLEAAGLILATQTTGVKVPAPIVEPHTTTNETHTPTVDVHTPQGKILSTVNTDTHHASPVESVASVIGGLSPAAQIAGETVNVKLENVIWRVQAPSGEPMAGRPQARIRPDCVTATNKAMCVGDYEFVQFYVHKKGASEIVGIQLPHDVYKRIMDENQWQPFREKLGDTLPQRVDPSMPGVGLQLPPGIVKELNELLRRKEAKYVRLN